MIMESQDHDSTVAVILQWAATIIYPCFTVCYPLCFNIDIMLKQHSEFGIWYVWFNWACFLVGTAVLFEKVHLPFVLTCGLSIALAPASDSLMFSAGFESDELHCTLTPFVIYPILMCGYLAGIYMDWFIDEDSATLSYERSQAKAFAESNLISIILYCGKYAASKIQEPGCFASLSVKVARCYQCKLPVSKIHKLSVFNGD